MKQPNSKRRIWPIILAVFGGLVVAAVITALVLVQVGKNAMLNDTGMQKEDLMDVSELQVLEDGTTVLYQDTTYRYNKNMTTILCMGIDRGEAYSKDAPSVQGQNGQADALFLYTLDTKTGASTILPIPRDTMVEVDLYSPAGKYVSSAKKQVCLAYAYGDGKVKSCQNTVKAISRLLYGIPIASYVAIDMDAISVLVDAVDGVPVNPLSDMNYGQYQFKAGQEVLLKGEKALAFLMGRDQELDSSMERMGRQKQFVQSFFDRALAQTKKDIGLPVNLYQAVLPHMTTDINAAKVSYLTTTLLGGRVGGQLQFQSLQGKVVLGKNNWAEYYPEEKALYETVLNIFYEKAE